MQQESETGWDLSADPRAIWACWSADESAEVVFSDAPPAAGPVFRWLHLDLWLPPSLRWVERLAGLPDAVRALFVDRDAQPSAALEDGCVAMVLPDFEREFDRIDTGRLGMLHVAIAPGLFLTGRHHTLHTPDVIRHRLHWAKTIDAAAALDLVLTSLADTIASRTQSVATDLLTIEDQLLADEQAPDMRKLIGLRRLSARLHRMLAGFRTALLQLDGDPALAPPLRAVLARQLGRLRALESEIGGTQTHLRLLREELDLQAGQRTNENVYLLSIITALLMPATLVTGFFGMNTGGLPFTQGAEGTVIAALIGLLLSGLTWLLLRKMGLVRR